RGQSIVEIPIELCPFSDLTSLEHSLLDVQCSVQYGRVQGLHQATREQRLQQDSQFIDFPDFGEVECTNHGPVMRMHDDESLRCQVAQRFSNGRGAHTESVGDLRLQESSAAWQRPVHDRGADGFSHVLVCSRELSCSCCHVGAPLSASCEVAVRCGRPDPGCCSEYGLPESRKHIVQFIK